jgi:hypothetical protein
MTKPPYCLTVLKDRLMAEAAAKPAPLPPPQPPKPEK